MQQARLLSFTRRALVSASMSAPLVWGTLAQADEGDNGAAQRPAVSSPYLRQGQPAAAMAARLRPRADEIRAPLLLRPANRTVAHSPEAPHELEVDGVIEQVRQAVPLTTYGGAHVYHVAGSWMQTPQEPSLDYVLQQMLAPAFDADAIVERQAVWDELERFPELREILADVKVAADRLKWERSFVHRFDNASVQELEDAKLLVDLVTQIERIGSSRTSPVLHRLTAFADSIKQNPRFAKLRRFVTDIYVRYDLGEAIAELSKVLAEDPSRSSLHYVANRHRLNRNARKLLEAADVMRSIADYEGMTPSEPSEVGNVGSIAQLHEKTNEYTHGLLALMTTTDRDHVTDFLEANNGRFANVVTYMLTVLNEFRAAHEPGNVQLGELPEELGYIVGVARVHDHWTRSGARLVHPQMLPATAHRTHIRGALNTTLLRTRPAGNIVANDISSDPDENLFVLTGPNEAGKTTYVRQIGQHYWLAHLGMFLPTAEGQPAEVSLTDNIITALQVTDSTEEAQSHYQAELTRVRRAIAPVAGQRRATPYSLVLMDEFANGTDHNEALTRTRVVLRHFSALNTTFYLTSHKHEIIDDLRNGDIIGGMPLAMEIVYEGTHPRITRRVVRNTTAPSLGEVLAERIGVTPQHLEQEVARGALEGAYPLSETRLERYRAMPRRPAARARASRGPRKPRTGR